jgi:serine/threonine protein kinase
MAPEVHHYLGHGRAADFWSFGAFAFDMMCCDFPIKSFRYKDSIKYPEFLSKEAVSLFTGLLQTGRNRVTHF